MQRFIQALVELLEQIYKLLEERSIQVERGAASSLSESQGLQLTSDHSLVCQCLALTLYLTSSNKSIGMLLA